jgi:hypothetical protein
MKEWILYINDIDVGILKLNNIDQPWFHCFFEKKDTFDKYQSVFDEESILLEGDDEEMWMDTLEEIEKLDIKIIGEDENINNLIIHISGDTAYFRF